ncbi:MAG: Glu/Leu/Phe/Val dehydrogenase dimerization domain-containing protein [Cyclobacteriaceae bacterium]
MRELLKIFENKQPEIIFEWSDSESEAEGWLVINSLRGGAAGGGTRMKKGLDKNDVIQLAKTAEVKYTFSGPPIGGAKAGINFDPEDPRKNAVLKRWFKAVMPLLKSYFGTVGDLNVEERHELIPITEEYGLWHPQEGVVHGYYKAEEPDKIRKIGQLRLGLSKILENTNYFPVGQVKYTAGDVITGFGLATSIKHFYHIWGGRLKGKRAIIQGWGMVGATAAYFLANEGVKVVGIISLEGAIIDKEGLNPEEVRHLFLNKDNNQLVSKDLISFEEGNQKIWDLSADIFVPAARSRLVSKDQLTRMMSGGLELISSGANFPFAEKDIFLGPIGMTADENLSLIPDYISNMGIARLTAYLMTDKVLLTDEGMFEDVDKSIFNALKKVHSVNPNKKQLAQTTLDIALNQLL